MDDTFGYAVLSFLDAFSGFHQISMYLPDAEKMTFIKKMDILLPGDAFWIKKYRGHVSTDGQ